MLIIAKSAKRKSWCLLILFILTNYFTYRVTLFTPNLQSALCNDAMLRIHKLAINDNIEEIRKCTYNYIYRFDSKTSTYKKLLFMWDP